MPNEWIRVTKRRPCPICGKPNWCSISADSQVAHCMRAEKGNALLSGGWIHTLAADTPQPGRQRRRRPSELKTPPSPPIAWEERLWKYAALKDVKNMLRLAERLGVTTDSLQRLGIVRVGPHRAWGFPMRDAAGNVTGIRLRNDEGHQWAITGSKQGIFWPTANQPWDGDAILICEGPTDTAALLDLGFYAIGRPSCTGGTEILNKILPGKDVVIIADRDEAKTRPDGSKFYPGQHGAKGLAIALALADAKSIKIIMPLKGKDARDWKRAGATHDVVAACIRQARIWQPTRKEPTQ